MLPKTARITLIAPGCFSELAPTDEGPISANDGESVPELNAVRVVETGTNAYEQALLATLHQDVPMLGDLPIAAHRFLIDADKKSPSDCVCVQLIHLQADTANARLRPMQALGITNEESDALVGALNDLIRDDGMEVIRTNAMHYYLLGMDASELDTWPAHAVANGKIADYLPRKANAGDWRRLVTEVQMLFHSHPVNQARVSKGQLPINGMWFWGGRAAPAYKPVDNVELVTNDAYAEGLAKVLGIEPLSLDDTQWTNNAQELVVLDLGAYEAWLSGDIDGLHRAKQQLNERWILPAQQAVASGQCDEFVLDGCEGQAIVETPRRSEKKRLIKAFSFRQWFLNIRNRKERKRVAKSIQGRDA